MTAELLAAIIGGVIGILGSLSTTLMVTIVSNRRRVKAIKAIVKGEIIAIKEKAERYISGQSSEAGLKASSPMLVAIASELGYLSESQAIALRRCVTLDMEMRTEVTIIKAQLTIEACDQALHSLSS